MPKRTDIKSILIIGAGPIVIGQACEFDYSGAQACKALRAQGYRIVLVNSNPATIMTDPGLADATYIEPITPEIVAKIIEKERPDALLPTMGGQTALNTAMKLADLGVLEKFGVEMIGAKRDAIDKAEDRLKFRDAMDKIGLESPRSRLVTSIGEARDALDVVGLPAIIRPSFTLAGTGGGIAYNKDEYEEIVAGALQDYGRAVVVGDPQTHGKGTVQQVIPLTPQLRGRYDRQVGGAFKISIQKFYRVNGGSTQLEGVAADVVLPSAWEGWDVYERDLDHAMAWDRIPPAPYAKTGDPSAWISALRARSAARVASDPDFADQRRITEERVRRKEAPSLSLSLEERRADLAAWKALTDAEDVDTSQMSEAEKKAYLRANDHALDEGEAVLVDLITLAR
jgi:hypothetical protein